LPIQHNLASECLCWKSFHKLAEFPDSVALSSAFVIHKQLSGIYNWYKSKRKNVFPRRGYPITCLRAFTYRSRLCTVLLCAFNAFVKPACACHGLTVKWYHPDVLVSAMDLRGCYKAIAAFCFLNAVVGVFATPRVPIRLQRHLEPCCAAEEPLKYPDTLTSEPIPFKWGFSSVTNDLAEDAARNEDQLSELLDSPLSDWQALPRVCTFCPVHICLL
jgi:hypothetical protein